MSPEPVGFGELIGLWEDGQRRLARAQPDERPTLERVRDEIIAVLRRRLGGPFTTGELAELYLEGTDWCFEIATRVAPHTPAAWDIPTVAGAAFARYAREAVNYSVGRRVVEKEGEEE